MTSLASASASASPSLALLPLVHPKIRARLVITPSGCWQWAGGKSDEYGLVTIDGKAYRIHRFVWKQLMYDLPRTVPLDHLCRNRACCNPDHLEPVSTQVNSQRGLKARLKEDQVRMIRDLQRAGRIGKGPGKRTMRQVGIAYGVTGATISRILARKLWRNVP